MGEHLNNRESMLGAISSAGRKLAALVVDDDPIIRENYKMFLSKIGCETQTVENGEKAVELFANGEVFGLILMNMEMPIMDGPQATKILRGMGVNSVIVGITSRNVDSEQIEFMKAGLNYCFVKPMTLKKIESIVDEMNY